MAGVTRHNAYDIIPEDELGEEFSPNAKLWQIYLNEAQILDNLMTKELTENADVLLVFSGLFSAVVTAFVTTTSQNLQMDYAPITVELLFEMVQLQRAALNGSDGASVQPSSWTPSALFSPSSTDVWVNGLWFTSLTISLIAALVAVLSKQWVSYYVSQPGSGSAIDKVRIRQFRYTNFQKWSIPVIIGVLPILLHIALAMFLVGLVIFLSAFVYSFVYTMATLTILTFLAYTATVILSTFDPSCPYRTPLSGILYSVSHQFSPRNSPSVPDLSTMEQHTIDSRSDSLDLDAILWLLHTSSNATVRSVLIEALGSIPPQFVPTLMSALVSEYGVWEQHHTLLKDSLMHTNFADYQQPRPGFVTRVDRLLQVLRRLAPPRIIASEAPLTSHIVPRGFFENDYNPSSLLLILLLEMQGADREIKRPPTWPSPAEIISRVIWAECKFPWHTWQDFFAHVDLASMCVLTPHIPAAERFCAAYLNSHAEWYKLNDGLPQFARLTDRTEMITFSGTFPHFEEQIDEAILAQFQILPSDTVNRGASVHARVVTSVLDHMLSSDLATRLAREDSCRPCRDLFISALDSMCAILSQRSLSPEDSEAYKDLIQRILFSDLFADRVGHQNNDSLWDVRRSTLLTINLMAVDNYQLGRRFLPHCHRWPISEDVVNICIRMLHPNSAVARMSHGRMYSNLELSRMISQHWFTSDFDTTYSTFLEIDAFVFLDHTKYLFANNILFVAAYVQGLLRAKDNGTHIVPYTEYLYRSDNLHTALIIVTAELAQVTPHIVTSLLIKIVKLCPLTPQEAQSCWTTALQGLDTFSNIPDGTEHEYFSHNRHRMVSYTPAQIAQIKSRVKYWRNFLAGYIERLQSNSLEPSDEIDIPFRLGD